MIYWPLIISFNGDDELSFINDENDWKSDSDLYFHSYAEGDEVIDCQGKIFELVFDEQRNSVDIRPTGKTISIREFELLVKKHMVQLNQCCISKFQIASIHEGMKIIQQTVGERPNGLFSYQAGLAAG